MPEYVFFGAILLAGTLLLYGGYRIYRFATDKTLVVRGIVEQTLMQCQVCRSLGLHIGQGLYEFYASPSRCKSQCNYQKAIDASRALAAAGGERAALAGIKKMLDQAPGLCDRNRDARAALSEVNERLHDSNAWRQRALTKTK